MRRALLTCFLLATAGTAIVHAQNFSTAPCQGDNEGSGWGLGWFGHDEHTCEVRRTTVPLTGGHLGVSGQNGGIEVVGEDRSDIALEARVTAQAPSKDEAERLLHEVHILTASDNIRADGPKSAMRRTWSVSYKLRVPRRIAQTELQTSNGGITISDLEGSLNASSSNGGIRASQVTGEVRASTTNGGLTLENMGGSVHAETTNGGVRISLAGNHWQGKGLFAKSTNGGITVKAPDQFRAHLVADTTNGGISVDFPITLQGKIGHHIDTDLNGGGPTVQLETTNGGVSIDKL